MKSAISISEKFLRIAKSEDRVITPLGIGKYVYLANGIHLARHGISLVEEELEARIFGPVWPTVFNKYSRYGTKPILNIDSTKSEEIFDLDESESIEMAWKTAKDVSEYQLSIWSHDKFSLWKKSYKSNSKEKI